MRTFDECPPFLADASLERRAVANAIRFQRERRRRLVDRLGSGREGVVCSVPVFEGGFETAIKFHADSSAFRREVAVYRLLAQAKVERIGRFQVPQFLGSSARHRAVEMTIVHRPHLLDFSSARLPPWPTFSDEVWEETRAGWAEEYGDDWPEVHAALIELEALGILYLDVARRNIALD